MGESMAQTKKNILCIAATDRLRDRIEELTRTLNVAAYICRPDGFDAAVTSGHAFDVLVLDTDSVSDEFLSHVDAWIISSENIPVLLVMNAKRLPYLLKSGYVQRDFIMHDASLAEYQTRLALLIGKVDSREKDSLLTIDNMTINLVSYQVYVSGRPVDLTLMEYSLLAFLVTHPSHAYSRESLLHKVWGFEYCGGTRTVDVHIRRVRSKIGSQVASHICTVRGVGYLFKM